MMSKPKLNDKVYFLFENSINEVRVMYLGEVAFVHSDAFKTDYKEEYRRPLLYAHEEETWTKTFEEARAILNERYPNKTLKQFEKDYWEMI